MLLTGPGESPGTRRTALYVAILASSTVAFAALGAATLFWEDAAEVDVRFVRWVHDTSPAALVDLMQVVTYAGSGAVLGPLALVVALAFVRSGRAGPALFVLAALVGGLVLSQFAKAGFRRSRPELEDPFVLLTTYAFPSGHAFAAAATYGALALVVASDASGRRRPAVLAGGALVVALVAASRVVLGVHYLLDVVAGIVGGVAWISALLLVLQDVPRPALRVVLFPRQEQPQRAGIDA